MKFKEWREWFRELPWTTKWFVVLILLRPIIDNFYKLKEVSPFLSPLNIVGVLTPILIFASISSKKTGSRTKSTIVNFFFIFGFLVLVNWILIDVIFPKVETFGYSIKAIIPPILFLYLLYVIKSQRDLHGILVSFLYSGIYLLCLMLYEIAFGSISGGTLSEGRGGGQRLLGFYNDMMNYAVYIVGTLLIGGYFFLRNVYSKIKSKNYVLKFIGIIMVCMVGLIGIKHVSSWVVCLTLFSILSIFNLKNFKGFFIILFIATVLFTLFGEEIYKNQIEPLVNKEINVANGDAEIEGGLNGRVGRWERYFEIWFSEIPIYSRLIGIPTSGHRFSVLMCSGGMHNDYIRNLFTTGIIGILFYLIFLAMMTYRALSFKIPERFLILGALAAFMLHSISTLPLAYSSYTYLFFTILSYALLPLKKAYRNEARNVEIKDGNERFQIKTRHRI